MESGRGNAADLFADAPFDAATLALMLEAYAAARHELRMMNVISWRRPPSDEIRWKLAARILMAAGAGERDPERMKRLALRAVDPDSK